MTCGATFGRHPTRPELVGVCARPVGHAGEHDNVLPETGWTRCPSCRTSGTPHEPGSEECREAALERAISQSDE